MKAYAGRRTVSLKTPQDESLCGEECESESKHFEQYLQTVADKREDQCQKYIAEPFDEPVAAGVQFSKIFVNDAAIEFDQAALRLVGAAVIKICFGDFVRVKADDAFRRQKLHKPDQVPHVGDRNRDTG